jgi:hypothetical protein
MPLMSDWVEDLVTRLGELGIGYVQATGLSREMDGQRFEEQLGTFLRSVQAFDQIKPLLEPITQFADSPSMFMQADQWDQWHHTASFQLGQIVGVIHKSLYALFADAPIDEQAAQRAYAALFAELGLSPTARIVYATTNYDTIGENTLLALGAIPDVGDIQVSPLNPAERAIRVDGYSTECRDSRPSYTSTDASAGFGGMRARTRSRSFMLTTRIWEYRS